MIYIEQYACKMQHSIKAIYDPVLWKNLLEKALFWNSIYEKLLYGENLFSRANRTNQIPPEHKVKEDWSDQ